MRINSINRTANFKGAFFLTADNHSKPVASVGLFQKIGESAKDEPSSIYIDNGDFYMDTKDLMTNIYTTFAQKNKNIQPVFNLGNSEFYFLANDSSGLLSNIDKLSKSGITVICSPIVEICKKLGIDNEQIKNIKPYAVVKDNIEGEDKDILIVGSVDIRNNDILTTEKQAEILIKTINEAKRKVSPYKTILVSHNSIEDTKKILDILQKSDINNIELVSGGHSHKIEDEIYKGARILHPAPQGKSAYKVISDSNGFHMAPVKYDKINRYDYKMQKTQNNNDIIDNLSFDAEKTDKEYLDIINKTDLLEEITECTTDIKGRQAGLEISYPSELGTMLVNKFKEETGADLAIMLSQDIRGTLPDIGKKIFKYDILDILNVDRKLVLLSVNKEQLFDIFNISLKQQHDGNTNSDFLEFSDNIVLERYTDIEDEKTGNFKNAKGKIGCPENQRVKEIYIKKYNKWQPISKMSKDKKLSVVCCTFLAQGGRSSLSYFKNLKDKKELALDSTSRNMFTEALKDIQEGKVPIKKSIIIDCKSEE